MARRNSNSNPRPRGAGPREANARHKRKRAGNRPGTGSVRQEPSAPGSLIGGIRSRGIHAIKPVETNTPGVHELTDEERRAKWQPPERDKAWFSGTSASRHKASSSYKVASDYSDVVYDSGPRSTTKPADKSKKKTIKSGTKPKKSIAPKTGPLSDKEREKLDNSYRLFGKDPTWPGWRQILPRRTRRFIAEQIKALGLDTIDDSRWTKGERHVFTCNRGRLTSQSAEWSTLLPRKSARAIELAYTSRDASNPTSVSNAHQISMEE